MRKQIVAVLLMLLLQACTLPLTPLPTVTSTITAAPSETPTASRTPTPSRTRVTPTITPSLTGTPPTSTPTFGAGAEIPAATPALELNCTLIFKSVQDGVQYEPKERFNAGWMVKNTGTAAWEPGSVYLTYVSGIRMHKSASEVLDQTVSPGSTIPLTAEMIAPRESGNHQTIWSLRRGDDYFCPLSLRITVTEP